MNYILYDGAFREALLPFTFTRPVADIRIGILTIREKWEKYLRLTTTTLTEEYLSEKFPMIEMEENIFINAGYLPNQEFFKTVKNLKANQKVICNDDILAFYSTEDQEEVHFSNYEAIVLENIESIEHKWDLFLKNEYAIHQDFDLLTADEISMDIPEGVQVINKEQIFIEEGATIFPCVLNASNGPIYIGKDATILDGSLIRGPFALGEKAVVKMGAKVYGATTVGPNCKVGGEIKNSVIFGNSNKGHEGYLGNSVVGEWCNFGADTNVSNLKNTLSKVRLWNYEEEFYEDTQQKFCGLMMGDHSKTVINTMLNTGTVVGISANVFGADFPDKFIPSFTWGGKKSIEVYNLKKSISTATKMMELSHQEISEQDILILEEVYHQTKNIDIKLKTKTLEERVKSVIRDVPDFPKLGILFKDITPILLQPSLLQEIVDAMADQLKGVKIDAIAGIESRGYLFGVLLAQKLQVPFIMIRKEGKLPAKTIKESYDLEYGSATIEVHEDAIVKGSNVLIHDDLLATGGTAIAAANLIKQKANVAGFSFVIDLAFLKGALKLKEIQPNIKSLITY